MRVMVITISSLCMMAALCSRVMADNRFLAVLRLFLGLEITRIMLTLVEELVHGISGWS